MYVLLSFLPNFYILCHEFFFKIFSSVVWISFSCNYTKLCIQNLISVLQNLLMLIHFCKIILPFYRLILSPLVKLIIAGSSFLLKPAELLSNMGGCIWPSITFCTVCGCARNKVSLPEDCSLDQPGGLVLLLLFWVFELYSLFPIKLD